MVWSVVLSIPASLVAVIWVEAVGRLELRENAAAIAIGASRAEVEAALGEPNDKHYFPAFQVQWEYEDPFTEEFPYYWPFDSWVDFGLPDADSVLVTFARGSDAVESVRIPD